MSVRPLPDDFERRFRMHLLRNMIFKSVIRVGAGYYRFTEADVIAGHVLSAKSYTRKLIYKPGRAGRSTSQ